MLPDLPLLKRDIIQCLIEFLGRRVNEHLGIFGDIPRQRLHEGDRQLLIREDGSREETQFNRAGSTSSIEKDKVHLFTIEARQAELERMAVEIADQIHQQFLVSIQRTSEEFGQVVDNQGKPFSAESVLAAFEMIQTEFDARGKPAEMSMLISPDLAAVAGKIAQQFLEDPELQRRHKELTAKKWMEWRDREASRKLVG